MTLFQKTDQPFPKDIPALTSLRFYMALMVVYHHIFTANLTIDLPVNLLSRGYLGVDFFFILSGFILAHTYANEFLAQTISKETFYLRRFARIYPLHLAILLLCVGLTYLEIARDYSGNGVQAFISNIFMVHAWSGALQPNYNTPSWSISAEWFAYLCLPFLLPVFYIWSAHIKRLLIAAIAGLVFFNMLSFVLFARPLTYLSYDWGILRVIPEFFLGVALYFFGRNYKMTLCNNYILAIACLGSISLSWVTRSDIPIVLSFAAIILICANQSRENIQNFLCTPVSVWLGKISYALYMVHIPAMTLAVYAKSKLWDAPSYPLDCAIYLLATPLCAFLLAIFAHYTIESPAQNFIRRLEKCRLVTT